MLVKEGKGEGKKRYATETIMIIEQRALPTLTYSSCIKASGECVRST